MKKTKTEGLNKYLNIVQESGENNMTKSSPTLSSADKLAALKKSIKEVPESNEAEKQEQNKKKVEIYTDSHFQSVDGSVFEFTETDDGQIRCRAKITEKEDSPRSIIVRLPMALKMRLDKHKEKHTVLLVALVEYALDHLEKNGKGLIIDKKEK